MISITVDGIDYRVFNHLYAVSRCGKVLRQNRPYLPSLHPLGYALIGKVLLHRAVAQCWLGGFDPRKHMRHINENKMDNRLENLECLTPREHLADRHRAHCALLGKYERTDASRAKLRQHRLRKKTSDETKTKQREALIGKKRPYFPRAKHTAESRAARSASHVRNTQCCVFGVLYRSFTEAGKATGVHRFTIRARCLSKNFPDYEVVF